MRKREPWWWLMHLYLMEEPFRALTWKCKPWSVSILFVVHDIFSVLMPAADGDGWCQQSIDLQMPSHAKSSKFFQHLLYSHEALMFVIKIGSLWGHRIWTSERRSKVTCTRHKASVRDHFDSDSPPYGTSEYTISSASWPISSMNTSICMSSHRFMLAMVDDCCTLRHKMAFFSYWYWFFV